MHKIKWDKIIIFSNESILKVYAVVRYNVWQMRQTKCLNEYLIMTISESLYSINLYFSLIISYGQITKNIIILFSLIEWWSESIVLYLYC